MTADGDAQDESGRGRALRWLTEDPAGGEALKALADLMDALEDERAANSDDGRAKAQDAALRAREAFDEATGVMGLLRRRMAVEIRALPSGAQVAEDAYAKRVDLLRRESRSPSEQVAMLQALARFAVDHRAYLGWAADVLAAQLLRRSEGQHGPFDGPVKSAGVDPTAGDRTSLRQSVIAAAGYGLGVKSGADGNVPAEVWRKAAEAYNAQAQWRRMAEGSDDPRNVSAMTVRGWASKPGDLSILFREARSDGARDRRANRIDHRRMSAQT